MVTPLMSVRPSLARSQLPYIAWNAVWQRCEQNTQSMG